MKQLFLVGLLLAMTVIIFAFSPRTVTGIVSDENGKALAYASVVLKGTNKSTFTRTDGSFSITVDGEQPVLVISSVGFQSEEIKVNRGTDFKIQLKATGEALHDVVIIGNGTSIRKDVLQPPVNALAGSLSPQAMKSLIAGNGNINTASIQLRGIVMGLEKEGYHDRYRRQNFDREGYDHITENPFLTVNGNPLSTFSIDVDAASYSNIRRILNSRQLPAQGAVRIEEMINYFTYEYAQPSGKDPFAVYTEMAVCPWNTKHQLVLIGLQGKKINTTDLPPSNLTFLIDVSGSMMSPDKLPLVKSSLKLLTDQLREQDKVSIVVYAGNAGLVLRPTSGEDKNRIKDAIDRLEAGGSTAGGAGIQLAYRVAKENFNKNGNNRVILCTDGDFNVGLSSDDALENLIEQERKSGIYLTVLGYGTGNYQDSKMQKLADKGNGNHAYIDGIGEAKKVLINEFGGTLFTIAKDVKLQVEFNPAKVKGYRLIGYENRMLAKEDFNDDKKDAGEMGSGHTVTALYELIPPGVDMPDSTGVDPLRYQTVLNAIPVDNKTKYKDEIMTIKLRYKQPDSDKSSLFSHPVKAGTYTIQQASDNFRFAAAVASFGMLLRNSGYKGDASFVTARSMAETAIGNDKEGYRKEFLQLVDMASRVSKGREVAGRE